MKTKQVLAVMITSLFLIYGCSNNDDGVEALTSKSTTLAKTNNGSVINQEYPDAQAEVIATFMAIRQSIIDGAGHGANTPEMDQLISFHDYGNIFTEFNYDPNGYGFLTDALGNEDHERELFGENVINVQKFAAVEGTLKVAVYYGNVANLTFTSDFVLDLADGTIGYPVNNLITLLFVKTKGDWKMVHEHHSPLKVKELPIGVIPTHVPSDFDPSSASNAQLDVLETFMAIRATILENSGTEPDNMDELISFHAYGPKFTEFNYDLDGNGYSFNSEENEANERGLFGTHAVTNFAAKPGTLNIAVYHRNVANVTFISDFEVTGIGTINNLITLLFVITKGEWKLVHEHHSPENH